MIKKLFLNEKGEISLMKSGSFVGSLLGYLLAEGVVPEAGKPYVDLALAISAFIALVGARNAMTGKRKKRTKRGDNEKTI